MSGALVLLAPPALAQVNYPTAAGASVKVPGVVPLQCNSSGQSCAPVTSTNPAGPNQVVGNLATDVAETGNPLGTGCAATTLPQSVYVNGAYRRFTLLCNQNGNVYVAAGDTAAIAGLDGLTAVSGFSGRTVSDAVIEPVAVANTVSTGSALNGMRGDTNGILVQNGLSAGAWSYTSGTSPILSNTTTAVTIKTAAGASVKNFIDSCQLTTTAFTASVPLAIRDGAGGTVKWALTVPTAGFLQPVNIVFETPIASTANTLLEVVTTTANTAGTVTLNCQGHTGS